MPGLRRSTSAFLRQLAWREFSQHLLYHFPATATRPMRAEFEHFPWGEHPRALRRWQRGTTGYPLVDAGMRELWQTGWMHNRVRMVVASFLVKHLLVHWRHGARWFWDTLFDADLANNTFGWQWVSGCGADAAPYFRIFNPVAQGERFDAQGDYVRRWSTKPQADANASESASRCNLRVGRRGEARAALAPAGRPRPLTPATGGRDVPSPHGPARASARSGTICSAACRPRRPSPARACVGEPSGHCRPRRVEARHRLAPLHGGLLAVALIDQVVALRHQVVPPSGFFSGDTTSRTERLDLCSTGCPRPVRQDRGSPGQPMTTAMSRRTHRARPASRCSPACIDLHRAATVRPRARVLPKPWVSARRADPGSRRSSACGSVTGGDQQNGRQGHDKATESMKSSSPAERRRSRRTAGSAGDRPTVPTTRAPTSSYWRVRRPRWRPLRRQRPVRWSRPRSRRSALSTS